MKRFILVLPFLALVACETPSVAPPPANPLPDVTQDTCSAARHAGLIGQNATALERVLLMGQVRLIRPNQAVTLDFRPSRINFNIDDENRIASIRCG